MSSRTITVLVLGFLVASSVAATGITDPIVEGNSFRGHISLPGGFDADLSIEFEEVTGLSVESLGVSAKLYDPFGPIFEGRLPDTVALPTAFPVLIRIQPPTGSLLSFRGVAAISLYTKNLSYVPGSRLRLCSATPGAVFSDITADLASGSIRAGGHTPDFAREYLIAVDQRNLVGEAADKLYALSMTLGILATEIEGIVVDELNDQLASIEQAVRDGDPIGAVAATEAFEATVERESGESIPDVWQAGAPHINAGGMLRAMAVTLRFTLLEQSNQLY